jgi:hypothetical protein
VQTRQRKGEGVLGYGAGEDAFGARPGASIVDEVPIPLDPRRGELDPGDTGATLQDILQPLRTFPRPHKGAGVLGSGGLSAPGTNRFHRPLVGVSGRDRNLKNLLRHVQLAFEVG